jgi:RNA polymerase sigma factor (sigma-70 family)
MNELRLNTTLENLIETLRRAYPRVYHALRSRFRDEQLADEISQECIGKAYERFVDDPACFADQDVIDWINRRAHWRALDQLRRRSRFKTLPEEQAEGDRLPISGKTSKLGPVVPSLRRLRENTFPDADRQLTWSCLQRLPEEEQEVLVGHHYEGLTDQELGTRLFGEDLSLQARGLRVWRLRKRAYSHLRAILLAEGFDPTDAGLLGSQAV